MDPMLSDAEAVRAANVAFYRAFEASDAEAMARLWSTTAPISCIQPGRPPAIGRDAVLAAWGAIFQGTPTILFTLRHTQILVAGDTAWVLLLEEVDATQDDGQRVRATLQTTNVFLREQGDWRLVHHHASPAFGEALSPGDPGRMFH